MMLHTATWELEFPFAEPPEFLTIQQDMSDENFIIPSEMKLTVHQSGTALNYTESLIPGASTTVRFDWEQAITEDASDAEWESWFSKQREATLGITSYSSVYSFVYIEPNEIRHEILIPLATLKTILPVKSRDASFIEIDEQEAIRTLIQDWLRDENPVTINGSRVMPEFSRIDFYGLDLRDFAAQAAEQKVSLASGRVGIILRYQTPDDAVRDATVTWEKYYSTMNKIQSVVISYPDRTDRFEFSRYNRAVDNVLKWTCDPDSLPQPIESVPADHRTPTNTDDSRGQSDMSGNRDLAVCGFRNVRFDFWSAGSALILAIAASRSVGFTIDHPWQKPAELSQDQATEIFQKLHQGVYRSLDFGSEDRVYDVLATSVDGPLLETLYLQLHQSLEMREQSGAVARIQAIHYESGRTHTASVNHSTVARLRISFHMDSRRYCRTLGTYSRTSEPLRRRVHHRTPRRALENHAHGHCQSTTDRRKDSAAIKAYSSSQFAGIVPLPVRPMIHSRSEIHGLPAGLSFHPPMTGA